MADGHCVAISIPRSIHHKFYWYCFIFLSHPLYTAVIFYLGLKGWNPVLLAVAGAFGSTAGEFTGYLIGYCGRKVISAERKKRMEFFTKTFRKYGAMAIFIFALTPLPDDVIFIPLGTIKYPIWETITFCFAGKFFMCLILGYLGGIYGGALEKVFGEAGGWTSTLITIFVLAVLYYLLLKIDWQAFAKRRVRIKGILRVRKIR